MGLDRHKVAALLQFKYLKQFANILFITENNLLQVAKLELLEKLRF